MEGSPFAPICNELAAEFDTAEDTNNIEMTKELLDKAKKILADHDSPEYAPLFYVVGTSSTIERNDLLHNSTDDNPYMDEKVLESQKNVIWYFRHAEELLNKIEENEETKPYLTGIRMILYVNFGNALDFCERKCSAMDYYSKALALHPFGMAFGNIGKALEHYASLEGDDGHRAILFREAYKYYLKAEQADDIYTYEKAKQGFGQKRREMEVRFGKETLMVQGAYTPARPMSGKEYTYRNWCLENSLFLNTLNDLPEKSDAFMTDALQITSITTELKQKNPPFVFEMFNQIKEEYVYSRYLLYETISVDYRVHFADRETCLEDVLNYSSYSIRIEKMKTAYRTLYSTFDRIAFLLNAYLKLGLAERDVSYDRIWNRLKEKESKNGALYALHWINRDFKEKFGDADTPQTKKLKNLRNALEHKFVSVHLVPVEKEIEIGEDYIYRISEEHFVDCTMSLLKLVREAIIELTIAIRIEERQRNRDGMKIIKQSLNEYLDEYKV